MSLDMFRHWPHIGQRIVKTAIAVSLCMLIYYGRGYSGAEMPTEAAITAIVCMQPFVSTAAEFAISRFVSSLIGGLWGLALLVFLELVPALGANMITLVLLMGLGVLLSVYSTVLIRKPDTSSLAAIVFICVVAAYPEIDAPVRQSVVRMLDILIGTGVAIFVNTFSLPREKQDNLIFFVNTADLVPDHLSSLSPAAVFRLNALYNDGARICLCSEHAPAFFSMQLQQARVGVPMVVMDGAAIFDPDENRYLWYERILQEDFAELRNRMDAHQISYFVYTIHRDQTYVFHHGQMRSEEREVYDRMRRSPYRKYLEDGEYNEKEVVYLKVIVREEDMPSVLQKMEPVLDKGTLRHVVRMQAGSEGLQSLYIYHHDALMEKTQERIMQMLKEDEPLLREVMMRSPVGYRDDRSVMHLLHRIEQEYEPVRLIGKD